jgi:hypothetical protein
MSFTTVVAQSAPQTATLIEQFMRSQPKMEEILEQSIRIADAALTVEDLQAQVPSGPLVYNRASLVVYLEALVSETCAI